MLRCPRITDHLYYFSMSGQHYVADILAGNVIPVSTIELEILELCRQMSHQQIIKRLSAIYNEYEILTALDHLGAMEELSLLTLDEPSQCDRQTTDTEEWRPKLFIPYDFFQSVSPLITKVDTYFLLNALAQRADVHIAVPLSRSEQPPTEGIPLEKPSLEDSGFHQVYFERGLKYSQVRYVPEECDGVLALAAYSLSELVFFRAVDTPIMTRFYSQISLSIDEINCILAKTTVASAHDILSADAPWMRHYLSSILPGSDSLHIIPSGVDTTRFHPSNRMEAKQRLKAAFCKQTPQYQSIIGIFSVENRWPFDQLVAPLTRAFPDVLYIVITAQTPEAFHPLSQSVSYFDLSTFDDYELLPFLFNAMDILIFPATIGSAFSILLSAIACGVLPVILAEDRAFQDAASFGVPVEFGLNSIESIIHCLRELLEEERREQIKQDLSANMAHYTWDRITDQIIQLFQEYQHRKRYRNNTYGTESVVFSRCYDPARKQVGSRAFYGKSLIPLSIEEGIALALRENHTPAEIEVLLTAICTDEEMAKRVFARVFPG